MGKESSSAHQACAAVIAGDEALRSSLLLLIEFAGLETYGFAAPDDLLAHSRLDEQFVFIDCHGNGIAAIDELRRRGWTGIAVLMAEEEPPAGALLPEGPCSLLVKPFSSDDVLSVLHK